MKFTLNSLKTKLAAGLLLSCVFNASVYAINDVLDTPAVMSDIAQDNLLLDVTKAGPRLVAVGSRGHILVSEDQGKTWDQAPVPVSVLLTAVYFPDATHGWAVGHGGVILHSNDGGKTWVKQFDGNTANKSTISQAREAVEALEAELESALETGLEAAPEDQIADLEYALEEAQFSLEDAELDAEVGASKPFLDVYFRDRNTGFAVGAYGFIFKTEDGGNSWTNYADRMENFDRFHLNAITQIDDGTVLVAGEAGIMFRSEDWGESWETIESPYDGSFFGLSGTGEEGVVLAFGLRGNLFRSEDSGETWNEIESGTESTLMGAGYDGSGQISIVGNSGSVLFSSDSGRTFEERIRINRLGNIALVFVDDRRMVIVGESGINITTPAGENL